MNIEKVDKRLLGEISALSNDKKFDCLVYSNDFYLAKESFLRQKIHIKNEYLFINAFLCQTSQKDLSKLSEMRCVKFVSALSHATSLMNISKHVLGVDRCKLTGEGVGIAFIDTGVKCHADFLLGENRLVFFKDFIDNHKNFYDDNGHGTFVCGVACGNGCFSSFRYAGIAPKSNIFALKALDKNGEASASKILDAMQWIFDNAKEQNIKVVCMSFGSEPLGINDPIMIGAEALWKMGVVVVAAAGNSGPEFQTIKSPGISTKIITVGGIDDNRIDNFHFDKKFFEIAEFSSRGPSFRRIKPDLVAPSVDIVSCGLKNNYTSLSGTSVATPMIAGLCALLFEKYKDITPDEIKNILLKNCKPLGFDKNLEGFGLVDFSKFIE